MTELPEQTLPEQTPRELAYDVGCLLISAIGSIEAEMEQGELEEGERRIGLPGIKKLLEAAFEKHDKLYHLLLCTEGMVAKRTQGSA